MTRRLQNIHFDIHRGRIPQYLDNLRFLRILLGLSGIRFDLENSIIFELFAISKILVSLTYKKEEKSKKKKQNLTAQNSLAKSLFTIGVLFKGNSFGPELSLKEGKRKENLKRKLEN